MSRRLFGSRSVSIRRTDSSLPKVVPAEWLAEVGELFQSVARILRFPKTGTLTFDNTVAVFQSVARILRFPKNVSR